MARKVPPDNFPGRKRKPRVKFHDDPTDPGYDVFWKRGRGRVPITREELPERPLPKGRLPEREVVAPSWPEPTCPPNEDLKWFPGKKFVYLQGDTIFSLWFFEYIGKRLVQLGGVLDEVPDVETGESFTEWVGKLRSIRSSAFFVQGKIHLTVFPTQQGRIAGNPIFKVFEFSFEITRPWWRDVIVRAVEEHLIGSLEHIIGYLRRKFGGSPERFDIALLSLEVYQSTEKCVERPAPRPTKRLKPKRKPRPRRKPKPKPAPEPEKPVIERIVLDTPTGKQVRYRDTESGRFVPKPKPVRRRKAQKREPGPFEKFLDPRRFGGRG